MFSLSSIKASVGITELPFILFKNPIASGKVILFYQIAISSSHVQSGSWVRFKFYSNPTTSANGSSISIGTVNFGSGSTSVALAYNTPTVSANGSLWNDISVLSGTSFLFTFPLGSKLQANQTTLITVVSDSVGREATASLIWDEQ
jgi:hypothetical protein